MEETDVLKINGDDDDDDDMVRPKTCKALSVVCKYPIKAACAKQFS